MVINILLATYNGANFISQQLDSILAQELTKDIALNIYLSDDSSSDNTIDIVKEHYPMVNILSTHRKGGVVNNFKYLIDHCDYADLYFFSDQDDVWFLNKIKLFLEAYPIDKKNKPCLIHSDLSVVDTNLNIIHESMFKYQGLNKKPIFDNLLICNSITGCVCAVNHEAIKLIKNKSLGNIIMHDWFMALLCSANGELIFIDKPTIKYRQHGNNQVGAKENNIFNEMVNYKISYQNILKSIKNTKVQAKTLSCFLNDNSYEYKLCEKYNNAYNSKSILERVFFIFYNNKIKKNGFLKTILFRFLFVFIK